MTLTKLLCKYFDGDEKGYVTLGDIVTRVLGCAVLIIIVGAITFIIGSAYLHGAWLTYNGAIMSEDMYTRDDMSCVLLFIVVSGLMAIWVGAYIIAKLSLIRVVTCERKDGDDEVKGQQS